MSNDPAVVFGGTPPMAMGGIFSVQNHMAAASGSVPIAISMAINAANAAGGGLVIIPANIPAGGVISSALLGANTFLTDYRAGGLEWGPGNAQPGLSLIGPIVYDVASLSSPAGATPTLKSNNIPAGALVAGGAGPGRGVRFTMSGTFANNVNAKTLNISLNGGAGIFGTALTATVSTANAWRIQGEIYVRAAAGTIIVSAIGWQGPGTPTWTIMNAQATGVAFTSAISVAVTGTQTSAADIIQDYYVMDYMN